MADQSISVGTVVVNPQQPEYGPGKVVAIRDGKARVHFRDDRDADVRIYKIDDGPLEAANAPSDPYLDNLPSFVDGAFVSKSSLARVTFQDGLQKFLAQFPGGFSDSDYLGTGKAGRAESGERNYKWRAHEQYEAELGNGIGESLLHRGEIAELSARAVRVATGGLNLLSPYESMAFRDGLNDDQNAATRYFGALLSWNSSSATQAGFEAMADAVRALPVKAGKARVATWPVLTLLPYLARPDTFMFLKPGPTGDCAERLRFELSYSAKLRWVTYSRLTELSQLLLERLREYGAKDLIDVQSFMWVVAKY